MSVPTNETASLINESVREQLVAAGPVGDDRITRGPDGLRIGVGDRVMTRTNDPHSGVANRKVWTVTAVHDDGRLPLVGPRAARGTEVAEAATRCHRFSVVRRVTGTAISTALGAALDRQSTRRCLRPAQQRPATAFNRHRRRR